MPKIRSEDLVLHTAGGEMPDVRAVDRRRVAAFFREKVDYRLLGGALAALGAIAGVIAFYRRRAQ